jgi:methyl-accepting chemotaxis protein
MHISFGKERAKVPDRTAFLLGVVETELGQLKPYLEIMRRQIAGAMEVTDSSVLGVIERINTVHVLTGSQVEHITASMGTSRNLVEEANQHSGQLNMLVDLVRTVIRTHLGELDRNIQRSHAMAEEIEDLRGIADIVAEIAVQSEMLGVNALIQAAQARRVGAAFSVVAGEMRKLSMKAGKAATDIGDRITSLTRRMSAEIAALRKLAEEVQQTADTLNRVIGDIQSFESVFNSSAQALSGTIDGLYANNSQIVTQLTEALGLIQFQDVVFQRMDHVDKALLELTQHSQAMLERVADPAWDGTLSPTLKERLDQHQLYYVMASQRDVFRMVVDGETRSSNDGPAIELF